MIWDVIFGGPERPEYKHTYGQRCIQLCVKARTFETQPFGVILSMFICLTAFVQAHNSCHAKITRATVVDHALNLMLT